MNTRLKFHAIAIAAIIVVVSTLYQLFGAHSASGTGQTANNGTTTSITIHSATWGEQCNRVIAETLKLREQTPLTPNQEPLAALTPVTPDNALKAVATLCDGKLACKFRATTEALGFDPIESCFKRLVVRYRCFSFDRLTTLDIGQGELLSIDCLKQPNADASTAPAP